MTAKKFYQNLKTNYSLEEVMEAYASHVLQEYKKELEEWLESQANFISDDDDIKDRYARSAYREVLTKLKEDEKRRDYERAEQRLVK